MKLDILDFLRRRGNRQNLIFPRVITDSELKQRLDVAFGNRNAYLLSILYRRAANDPSLEDVQALLQRGFRQKRNNNDDDLELISGIAEAFSQVEEMHIVFENVGNLIYLAEIADTLAERKDLPESIQVTCYLWLYLNMIEVVYSHMSELFFVIAQQRGHRSFQRQYKKRANKGEHPTRGELLDYAKMKDNQFTYPNKDSILHLNKLRNSLAHANCFYDSISRQVVLNDSTILEMKEFHREFQRVRDFLFELVEQLSNGDILRIKKEMLQLAKRYLELSRSPHNLMKFRNLNL